MGKIIIIIIRTIFQIAFIPLFLLMALLSVIGPAASVTEYLTTLVSGNPEGSHIIFLVSIVCLVVYLSLRIRAFQFIYRYIPIAWPTIQLSTMMFIGLGVAVFIIDRWAEYNVPSKGVAISLGVLCLLVTPLWMSLWFAKYPIAPLYEEVDGKNEWQSPLKRSVKFKRFIIGLCTLATLFLTFYFHDSFSDEDVLAEIEKGSSHVLRSGVTVENTDLSIQAKDLDVKGFGREQTRIIIWDLTGEGGGEIMLKVDGRFLNESHLFTTRTDVYSVPVPSVLTIQGVEGEVSYAVKFPDIQNTVFNQVSVGTKNEIRLVIDE